MLDFRGDDHREAIAAFKEGQSLASQHRTFRKIRFIIYL